MKPIVLALVVAAGGAAAEPMTGAAAGALAFAPGTSSVTVSSRLGERDQAIVRALVPLMERQIGRSLDYYGAIAMSPDEGFQSEASQSALNHHSVAAADAAALGACNARRRAGSSPCVLAARILPRGYEARALTLSSAATRALTETYARARAPKALAISAATGAFGVGAPDAALATCRRGAGGVGDCTIVVRD